MPLLEVSQTDVVIGTVHLRTDRKFFNHLTHHREALAKVACFVEADPHLQSCVGPLFFRGVFFRSARFEMRSSAIVGTVPFQQKLPQTHVAVEPHLAPGIPLDHRLPDLDRLRKFIRFESGITRFQQLAGSAVFDHRSASGPSVLLDRRRILGQNKFSRKNSERH